MRQSLKWINSNQYTASVCLKSEKIGFNYTGQALPKIQLWCKDLSYDEQINTELTYISLMSYLDFKFCRTPGSCKYANFVISSTPQDGESASLG